MPGASKNTICFKQILLHSVLEICCLSLHSLPMPLFIPMPKYPRVVTFNLDTSNLFKLFLLISIFSCSFVNTEFPLPAQLALNLFGIPDGSLAGLYYEFLYALCKISPGLMLEDPEVTFVLINGLLVPLACFLSLSISNP